MNFVKGELTMNLRQSAGQSVAVEIDHLAEDLLDAADAIERLTRKYSDDVQRILKLQAEQIRALAVEQGLEPRAGDDGSIIIED